VTGQAKVVTAQRVGAGNVGAPINLGSFAPPCLKKTECWWYTWIDWHPSKWPVETSVILEGAAGVVGE
jgi:hypothetical protein